MVCNMRSTDSSVYFAVQYLTMFLLKFKYYLSLYYQWFDKRYLSLHMVLKYQVLSLTSVFWGLISGAKILPISTALPMYCLSMVVVDLTSDFLLE